MSKAASKVSFKAEDRAELETLIGKLRGKYPAKNVIGAVREILRKNPGRHRNHPGNLAVVYAYIAYHHRRPLPGRPQRTTVDEACELLEQLLAQYTKCKRKAGTFKRMYYEAQKRATNDAGFKEMMTGFLALCEASKPSDLIIPVLLKDEDGSLRGHYPIVRDEVLGYIESHNPAPAVILLVPADAEIDERLVQEFSH